MLGAVLIILAYGRPKAKKPLLLVIDLGSEQTVTGLDYLPRAEKGAPGSISRLSVYIY